MLGESETFPPLGQALRCCTKGQQQFCSKQPINRAIMYHVPEHLHSHFHALLSRTAVDGNWIMQLDRIGNIFNSEQYAVSEECFRFFFSSHPVWAVLLQSAKNSSNNDFWSHSAWWYSCQQCYIFQSTHTNHMYQYLFAYIPNTVVRVLKQANSVCICKYRCPLSVIEDDKVAAHVWGYCSWNTYESKWQSLVSDDVCGVQSSLNRGLFHTAL